MKRKFIVLASILISQVFFASAQTSIITTVAGIGFGDSSAATNCKLYNPYGVAVDETGNIYIADTYNCKIRKVDGTGKVTTFAGNGTCWFSGDECIATVAELNQPTGIAVDTTGNVYIADAGNNRIRKVNTSGIITTVAGYGTAGYSGDGGAATAAELNNPYGVAVDILGNVFIADKGNSAIRMINNSGTINTIAGNGISGFSGDGGIATAAEISNPNGVAIDAVGNIYIVDQDNDRIRMVTTDGMISTVAGGGHLLSGDGVPATEVVLYYPNGIAVDDSGNIYIAYSYRNTIRKVNSLGIISTIVGNDTAGYKGDGGAATNAELDHPFGITIDAAGNKYIADEGNSRVRMVNTFGIITTKVGYCLTNFGGDGGVATDAELCDPFDIAIDVFGNIFVADAGNGRIRKIDTSGVITTVAGNGLIGYTGDGVAATNAELNGPIGLALDTSGNVYIADEGDNVIRKVDKFGTITTFAGTGTSGYSGDGGPATAAELSGPTSIVLDTAGNIYIAANKTVRKINSSGIISTIAGNASGSGSGAGGAATAAGINVAGIALDLAGNLYIADLNGAVLMVNTVGMITRFAGTGAEESSGDGGPATSCGILGAYGVCTDSAGNVFISDLGGNRIRRVNTSGIITTIAGNGIPGYFGDGGPASDAELSRPLGIKMDPAGNLFVADLRNNRIRRISNVGWRTNVPNIVSNVENVNIYPNPANTSITISSTQTIDQVSIVNIIGQCVYDRYCNGSRVVVDVADLPTGIYLVKVNNVMIEKLVKD